MHRTLLPGNERNRNVLAKALIAGGHPRIIVRSDGEPRMLARVRAVRVVATLADAPLQCDPRASEQRTEPRKWQGRWRGESTRQGLRRQILEDEGARAWLVRRSSADADGRSNEGAVCSDGSTAATSDAERTSARHEVQTLSRPLTEKDRSWSGCRPEDLGAFVCRQHGLSLER